jgi:nucleoid-associated protein YgaU
LLVPDAAAPRILQEPATPAPVETKAAPAVVPVTLDRVDYDDAGAIRFTGGAAAGATVRVYVDNSAVGDQQADAGGRWALTPGGAVVPGLHSVRVDALDGGGLVVSRVELPFQRAALPVADTGLAGGRVVVQPGQNLWRLARSAYGRGVQYTVIYLANRGQIRDPKLIYPGQAFSVPAAAH